METLQNNIKYELLNYNKYQKRLQSIIKKDSMQQMGIKYKVLGSSSFGYNIDCITVGFGKKKLFIVGGTHGSEIISVDFVLQFLENLDILNEFDPNLFTIVAIPLQNPEGFIVTTSSIKSVANNLEKNAYDYYLRYRIDNIFNCVFCNLNSLFISNRVTSVSNLIKNLKTFIKTDPFFLLLQEKRSIPEIVSLIEAINEIPDNLNYLELKTKLISIVTSIEIQLHKKEKIDIHDTFYLEFLSILKEYFSRKELWETLTNSHLKLHQDKFQSVGFDNIEDKNLRKNIEKIYEKYKHPLGSQATFDATGVGINLNANTLNNPGILDNNGKEFGLGARNNIINHIPGPLGSSKEHTTFSYAIENKILFDELNRAYIENSYLATLLYHGTGGMIFYKPVINLTNKENIEEFYTINENLANVYSEETKYRLVNESPPTGYGDFLRGKFPGVLMIELSKMGGNPLAPYGEKNNIAICYQDNFNALNKLFAYYKINLTEENTYKK